MFSLAHYARRSRSIRSGGLVVLLGFNLFDEHGVSPFFLAEFALLSLCRVVKSHDSQAA